jgi:hypothetical protein
MKEIRIGPITIYDPELDTNFYLGVYLTREGKYVTASPLSFQDNSAMPLKVGGELRNRPYFMVRGRNILHGEDKLKQVLANANDTGNITRDELVQRIMQEMPEAIIFDNHEVEMRLSANSLLKTLGLDKK